MNALHPPPHFEPGNAPYEGWCRWRERYNNFAIASGILQKTVAEQRATLLHIIGDIGYDIYETFAISPIDDTVTTETIYQRFDDYYRPYANEIYQAHLFHSCQQQQSQSIDEFVNELKRRVKGCGYGSLQDRLVRDKLVSGIKDKPLQERLLREHDLTLASTIAICRAAETSKNQIKAMTAGTMEIAINQIQDRQVNNYTPAKHDFARNQQRKDKPVIKNQKCPNCPYSHPNRQCPAIGKSCNHCNKVGHFAALCRTRARRVALVENEPQEEGAEQQEEFTMDTITRICAVNKTSHWTQTIVFQGIPVRFKIDTGADVNVVPISLIKKHNLSFQARRSKHKLSTYTNQTVPVIGVINVPCVVNSERIQLQFYVTEMSTEPVLGATTSERLGLVVRKVSKPMTISTIESNDLHTLMQEYSDVFEGMGKLRKTYHIFTDPSVTPQKVYPRKIPKALEGKVQDEIKWLLQHEIIQPVTNPTEWVNPVVIVPKKDGTVRVCLDPVHLNKAIIRKIHYLPTVEEMLVKLKGKQIFTLLDGKKGFYMVPLDEDSANLCTFATPFGLYKFMRLPFGIKNGPELFQEAMEDVFKTVPSITPFQDDLLISGVGEADHMANLRAALQAAREGGLKLNIQKSKVGLSEIKYLGQVINRYGIRPDQEKVNAITQMPNPKNKQDLQRLLGMLNYLSKFIPNHAEMTQNLRTLLRKDSAWIWDANKQRELENIKATLTKAPTLAIFNEDLPITIQSDASSYGLGACLLQDHNPVAFTSTTLTSAQRNYSQIEKELLAILHALQTWDYYIYGRPVNVETDHKPLLGLLNKPFEQTTPRLQRMRLSLQRYDITLYHLPGKQIQIADTLSRAPVDKMEAKSPPLYVSDIHTAVLSQFTTKSMQNMATATAEDHTLQLLMKNITAGWQESIKNGNECYLQPYSQWPDELHIVEGLVCRGQRIIIPRSQRQEILRILHQTHRGIGPTTARAKQHVYWPGMTKDIETLIKSCSQCGKYQNNNAAEPVLSRQIATSPWHTIALDYYEFDSKQYLLCVDQFSSFTLVKELNTTSFKQLRETLQDWFAIFGYPRIVISDNGPPFSSQNFSDLLDHCETQWYPASPYYQKSNGLAERTIQTIKQMMRKTAMKVPVTVIVLEHNATPTTWGWSPSQQFLYRHTRTALPSLAEMGTEQGHTQNQKGKNKQSLTTTQMRSANLKTRPLQPIQNNTRVWFKHKPNDREWTKGIVIQPSKHPRSYIVQSDKGAIYRRNRFHIKLRWEREKEETQSTSEDYYQVAQPQMITAEVVPNIKEGATRYGRIVKKPSYLKDFIT